MINEYAIDRFPMVLELRYLWWGPPVIPELGECDIPRVVRWEGEEYEFVAAILHSTDPAHWSSRVLYRDHLYSGQAESDMWGPWLVQVNRSGYDTDTIAWKMTTTELASSYPTRLYFVKRTSNPHVGSNQRGPEGTWFRLDGSTDIQWPGQPPKQILPTLQSENDCKKRGTNDDANPGTKRVKLAIDDFTNIKDVIQPFSVNGTGDRVDEKTNVFARDMTSRVENQTPQKVAHSISTIPIEENTSVSSADPAVNKPVILPTNNDTPSMTQTTEKTTNETLEKTSSGEPGLPVKMESGSQYTTPKPIFPERATSIQSNGSPSTAFASTSSAIPKSVFSNSGQEMSPNPFNSPMPFDPQKLLWILENFSSTIRTTYPRVDITSHPTSTPSAGGPIPFLDQPVPNVFQMPHLLDNGAQHESSQVSDSVLFPSNSDLKRLKTITPVPPPYSDPKCQKTNVVDLTTGNDENPKIGRQRSGVGAKKRGQKAKQDIPRRGRKKGT